MSGNGEREPVHEYDVVANGYDTVMNLTETEQKRDYPDAKRRSGQVAPDHPDAQAKHGDKGQGEASGKARSAPNK